MTDDRSTGTPAHDGAGRRQADMTAEEMSHVTHIYQRQQGPVNEMALRDCVRTIKAEHRAANVSSEDDLMALRERMKERKGIKG